MKTNSGILRQFRNARKSVNEGITSLVTLIAEDFISDDGKPHEGLSRSLQSLKHAQTDLEIVYDSKRLKKLRSIPRKPNPETIPEFSHNGKGCGDDGHRPYSPVTAYEIPLLTVMYERAVPTKANDLIEMLPSKMTLLQGDYKRLAKSGVRWKSMANDSLRRYLVRKGLARRAFRGVYEITDAGLDHLAQHGSTHLLALSGSRVASIEAPVDGTSAS